MPDTFNDLSAIRQPVATAHGLPNRHYTDPAVHNAERQRLFFDQWAGLATAAEVPENGDALPVDFLGVPLLLLRGRDGAVRVFQNICRHRGMILISEPRKIEGAIRCPYHSWCYGTDGRLVATPHVGGPGMNTHEAIDRDALGLIEVRSHVWRDVVFVNLSGTALPFDEAQRDLIARWSDFDAPLYHGGAESRFTLEVRSNWKLAVENYCESYHLPWVHPGLNAYSRLEDHYNIEAPGLYSGQGSTLYRQLRGADGATFPDFPALPAKWDTAAEYAALYPNVLFGVHRDHAFAIILRPDGQGRTVEHIHLYYATPDTDPALRAQNAALWKTVFEEDIFVVEGMQAGRAAPGFDGGRFSPAMDGPTHCFHDWVAGRMAGADAAA
ncbi:(2Fe-2S)-binding protein [Oceanicola sp. 22II-s10i]|uniref:aromatic ring-hydroxylating oxygenase subunit alpha n=1 Tax=Oceanicola sp. 22II-s10i TaxID=1317116 RepID=UPI000B51FEC6|nr:aromatic ring-hydroxylating dioxygenase subunit alpha [Oceanicola sp. 22II-s10i]OWU83506.1 (2Fe-2S)-binding protein [Oceanicola sp. 22II-s10i]